MKRRYTAAFIAVMIAGGLFAGCGSTARDNVASKEKDINKEQVATKAIAYEETFEKVTQKTDSENNKQTESKQQDANASDSSDNLRLRLMAALSLPSFKVRVLLSKSRR